MKTVRNGLQVQVELTEQLTESNELYNLQVKDKEIVSVDLKNVTVISSMGIKAWIMWGLRISKGAQLFFQNCPLVLVSQANVVAGFMLDNFKIDSFRSFFICTKCSSESEVTLKRDENFWYSSSGVEAKVVLPAGLKCKKCQADLEPDFDPKRQFKFIGLK